jgi:Tfp pilus assembly protein PilF
VRLKPLMPYHKAIYLKNAVAVKVTLNGETIGLNAASEEQMSRPLTHLTGFDWKSSYGLYLQGRDLVRFRNHEEAEIKFRQSIAANPAFMPALTEMASIQYHKMNYDSAYHYAKIALSIDAYEPAANFYYALSAAKQGKWADALDGFEVAGLNPGFSSAAATELSRMYLSRKDFTRACEYAGKSLEGNARNLSGLQLQYLAARLLNKETSSISAKILLLEPLNHFVRFEAYLANPKDDNRQAFIKYINGEAPEETFLDLAAWYFRAGRMSESRKVLEAAPANSEILFWRAYLSKDEKGGEELLRQANQSSASLVFPYLEETATVMEWARHQNADWKPVYYLSLIYKFRNDKEKAGALLEEVKTPVDFAPFYAYRSTLVKEPGKKLADLHIAATVDPRQWRYGNMLAEHYVRTQSYSRALEIIKPYYQEDNNNYITGMVYIRALLLNDRYNEAEKELSRIQILPFEDATYGRSLYRQTKLMLAYRALSEKDHKLALQKITEAELWPRNLGVGKPYENLIDSSMELWLKSAVYKAMGDRENFRKCLNRIKSAIYEPGSISSLIKSHSLKQLGLVSSANATFQQWSRVQKDPKIGSKGYTFFTTGSDFGFILKTISQKEDQRLF